MIVCVCHRVSDRDIARAAREGCASFDELQHELAVGTACGACHDCAHDTFQAARACTPEGRARCDSARIVTVPHRETVATASA